MSKVLALCLQIDHVGEVCKGSEMLSLGVVLVTGPLFKITK